jgi:hypothetical protein
MDVALDLDDDRRVRGCDDQIYLSSLRPDDDVPQQNGVGPGYLQIELQPPKTRIFSAIGGGATALKLLIDVPCASMMPS